MNNKSSMADNAKNKNLKGRLQSFELGSDLSRITGKNHQEVTNKMGKTTLDTNMKNHNEKAGRLRAPSKESAAKEDKKITKVDVDEISFNQKVQNRDARRGSKREKEARGKGAQEIEEEEEFY